MLTASLSSQAPDLSRSEYSGVKCRNLFRRVRDFDIFGAARRVFRLLHLLRLLPFCRLLFLCGLRGAARHRQESASAPLPAPGFLLCVFIIIRISPFIIYQKPYYSSSLLLTGRPRLTRRLPLRQRSSSKTPSAALRPSASRGIPVHHSAPMLTVRTRLNSCFSCMSPASRQTRRRNPAIPEW